MTKWTLVTGGAQGLGAATCTALARRGHHIVVHYRHSVEEARRVVAACQAFGVSADCCYGDFSTSEGLEAFLRDYLSRFGETKFLVNNVGNFVAGAASTTTLDVWRDLFQVNVFAAMALIQGLLSTLSSVVNIGLTGVERYHADSYCGAYSAAKAALWQSTRSLAKEFASRHIRFNMVSPGYMERSVDKPSCQQTLPMGREARLDEVAEAVAYLLDESSGYITGQNIEVAGGVRL